MLASEIDAGAKHTYRANFGCGGGSSGSSGTGSAPAGSAAAEEEGLEEDAFEAEREEQHHQELLIGDITGYDAAQLPAFDVLTAGFPCQPFTVRGAQDGLGDPRGQLYLEIVRVLRAKAPRGFLFENVAGLVVMDGGHVDIVRAMAWVPDNTSEVPVTGAEYSRVCVWGEKTAVDPGEDDGYIQAGGKIGREDEGGRRHSPY